MKVKELVEKLLTLNQEYNVELITYNEHARLDCRCDVVNARESLYYKNINDAEPYHYVVVDYRYSQKTRGGK